MVKLSPRSHFDLVLPLLRLRAFHLRTGRNSATLSHNTWIFLDACVRLWPGGGWWNSSGTGVGLATGARFLKATWLGGWGVELGELPVARAPAPPSASSGTCWLEGLLNRSCRPIGGLPGPIRPRPHPASTNPRVASGPVPRRARPSERFFRVGPGAEAMAPWALLTPGVLVRTGHTVLTWGITLVLFLHDTGEPEPSRPRTHPIPRDSPDVWVSLSPLSKPRRSWDFPDSSRARGPLPTSHSKSHLLSAEYPIDP